MDDSGHKLYTAPEAAEYFGLNRQYVTRRAREAFREGKPWPIRRGKPYEATLAGWDQILNESKRVKRKKRKRSVERKELANEGKQPPSPPLISASAASKKVGYSARWLNELGKRARENFYSPWPQWDENRRIWVAPLKQWQKIGEDPRLRSWMKK